VKITVNKLDEANTIISGTLDNKEIEKSLEKVAKQASKEIAVDGFRKGKVPVAVIKKMHGEKLAQDAESEVLQTLIENGIQEAGIDNTTILGQPTFKKYDKKENGIEVEIEISTRPIFVIDGYKEVVPTFDKPKAEAKEIEERVLEIATQEAPLAKISKDRAVIDGDNTLINFEGFIDDVVFDGGKAENFALVIGSGQFIDGFEEQIIGMNVEEEKTVTVTFPEEYQSKDLAGKEANFKVKLLEIQEKGEVVVNDALAQKLLNDEKATVETLNARIEQELTSKAISKLYNEELKPMLIQALVTKFEDVALPNNIVEQEVDAKINAKAQEMSEEELKGYKENPETVETLRDEVRAEAKDSVKATFLVDVLAKEEGITVEDNEVTQAIYYEAMMSKQDPQTVIKHYEDNNLLPAVKMGMIEDKLFGKILGLEG